MKVIGLIGGIASGKSAVAEMLRSLGAEIVNADRLGHAELENPLVIAAAKERWGPSVIDSQGGLHREAIARRIFASGEQAADDRQYWNAVLHPRIGEAARRQISEFRERGALAVVLDAALLLEAGWHHLCDAVIFVHADEVERVRRAATRGWTSEALRLREATQLNLAEKRRNSSIVIDNSGSLDQTYEQVRRAWEGLIRSEAAPSAQSPPKG